MSNLMQSARLLISDLASTLIFLAVLLATKDLMLAVALGVGLGLLQIGWFIVRRTPIDTMQWLSIGLVVVSGAATMLTSDARFVMLKPSVIYCIVGAYMLRPGWMNRYLPPIAIARHEQHAHGIFAGLRQAEAEARRFFGEQFVRDLHQNSRAIAGARIGAHGAAMLEVAQDGERILDELVRFASFDVGDEADPAGILIERRVVQALRRAAVAVPRSVCAIRCRAHTHPRVSHRQLDRCGSWRTLRIRGADQATRLHRQRWSLAAFSPLTVQVRGRSSLAGSAIPAATPISPD